MLSKFLTKLKETKSLKFPFSAPKFHTKSFTFKFSPKQFRFPTTNSAKVAQFVSEKVFLLQTLGFRLNALDILATLRTQAQRTRKYVNKKTFKVSLACCLAGYYAYEYNPINTKIFLSYENSPFNEKLVSSLTYLHDKHFYPSIFCPTALLQAITNRTPPEATIRYSRESIPLPDGGQVVLDWALPAKQVKYVGTPLYGRYYPYQPPKDNKIMFILHGLTGGSETFYIQTIVENARRAGYRVAVMNQRGVNQPLLTPMPFHGGDLSDLEIGLNHIREKYPEAPIVVVGTSFGGNQLMRYLGQPGKKVDIAGGAMVAMPFDIDNCVDNIQDTVYEQFFVRSYLEKNFIPNIDMLESLEQSHGVSIEQILKVKSLRDYHSLLTVKLYNHKDVKEYFDTTKVMDSHIEGVKVPLLVLHAKDDPIAVHESIPIDVMRKNPNIVFAETNRGGHLSWFTGLKPKRWYPKVAIEFCDKVLELKQAENKQTN